MPDYKDVMEYEKEATHHLELLSTTVSQTHIETTIAIGIEAVVHAILAVGVRVDYAISRLEKSSRTP